MPVRPAFESDGASVNAESVQPISPADASTALARFEFESGRGNDGTKVIMIEWEDDEDTKGSLGDWQVSWEGKSTVVPANDRDLDKVHRLFYLLPPRVPVPPVITLSWQRNDAEAKVRRINPLPAIFPPELGASARTLGKKGVLHTIWAKKRISVLQKEIEQESTKNLEGIALEMASQEKQWIEQNFGVNARPSISVSPLVGNGSVSDSPPSTTGAAVSDSPATPTSPKSPGGSRLTEKLRGLKVGTTAQDLKRSNGAPLERSPASSFNQARTAEQARRTPISRAVFSTADLPNSSARSTIEAHPLSPQSSDVAISSFAAFHGQDPTARSSESQAASSAVASRSRAFAAQAPPASVLLQQQQGDTSLDAVTDFASHTTRRRSSTEDHQSDDLFAVAMSPRSPEMAKSPFSFSKQDIVS
ncbi:MAG: hypothetical protein M1825_003002 [Sarcosagium campestre]|nr:MAG: hypothetical protein M1825_003002 [Sarcosagium campestre]